MQKKERKWPKSDREGCQMKIQTKEEEFSLVIRPVCSSYPLNKTELVSGFIRARSKKQAAQPITLFPLKTRTCPQLASSAIPSNSLTNSPYWEIRLPMLMQKCRKVSSRCLSRSTLTLCSCWIRQNLRRIGPCSNATWPSAKSKSMLTYTTRLIRNCKT